MAESEQKLQDEQPIPTIETEPDLLQKHTALCKLHVDMVKDLEDAKRTIDELLEEKDKR